MGAVSLDTVVPGITLVFKRSAAQEAELKVLLAAQQNQTSPLYHQWLTPESFAARFGAANEDIATTEGWLQSHGFHIDGVARSRDRITFSGTALQVQTAFGTALHHYRKGGETHFAPAADLSLPAELAAVTTAVLHLSDFRPKPSVKAQTAPHPDFTSFPGQMHYLGPKDIATMYNSNTIFQKGYVGGGAQGLAVVGQSYVDLTLGVSYFQGNLSQSNSISTVLVPGSGVVATSPLDEGESEIDLEYSSGINPNANIFLVFVGDNRNYDVFDALAFAITENVAPVVSISYGECEAALGATYLEQSNALFEEASAQGQTLVASSGDTGSTACAYYSSAEGVTPAQEQALSVAFPASSPYVTAVGGTQMAAGTFASGASPYWATANGGANVSSLLSYVPEVVWNEDSVANGMAASGGGASAYFPRPSWQTGVPGIPAGNYRLLPDIALQASSANPGCLFCTSDSSFVNLHGQTNSCANGLLGSNTTYITAGGTSFAAPVFAGLISILNGFEHTNGQGNVNPMLYKLAADPARYASIFHDITSGTNACMSGIEDCFTAGQSSFAATTGYDQATGLGSIDFDALARAWPSSGASNLQPTLVRLLVSPTGAAVGEAVSFQILVEPGYIQDMSIPSIATGSVSVSLDGIVVNPSLALSPYEDSSTVASAIYNYVAPTAIGSHLVAITYSGDATHYASTTTYSLPVGDVRATGSLSLAAGSNLSISNGGSGSTQITVTPSAGYNGRVVWSLAATGGSSAATLCYSIPSLVVNGASQVKLSLGSGAACSVALPEERRQLVTSRTGSLARNENVEHRRGTSSTVAYAGLLLCAALAGWRRKRPFRLLLLAVSLTAMSFGLNGCGGGGGGGASTPTNPTTPTGPATPASTTYTLTLTGKDSVNTAISASTSFTLTVN